MAPADAVDRSRETEQPLPSSESRAVVTDERLREEIARRERAEAELEASRKRDDGVATDQAGLLKAEIAARKAVEKELAAQRDEVEALTKEFEQQLDKELADKSKTAPPKKATGTITPWLVIAVFALTFGAVWILTNDGIPFMSQLKQLQYSAPIDEPD